MQTVDYRRFLILGLFEYFDHSRWATNRVDLSHSNQQALLSID